MLFAYLSFLHIPRSSFLSYRSTVAAREGAISGKPFLQSEAHEESGEVLQNSNLATHGNRRLEDISSMVPALERDESHWGCVIIVAQSVCLGLIAT